MSPLGGIQLGLEHQTGIPLRLSEYNEKIRLGTQWARGRPRLVTNAHTSSSHSSK